MSEMNDNHLAFTEFKERISELSDKVDRELQGDDTLLDSIIYDLTVVDQDLHENENDLLAKFQIEKLSKKVESLLVDLGYYL